MKLAIPTLLLLLSTCHIPVSVTQESTNQTNKTDNTIVTTETRVIPLLDTTMIRNMVMKELQVMNCNPIYNQNHDIIFQYQGHQLLAFCVGTRYVGIMLPNFWSDIKTAKEREKIIKIINEINDRQFGKIYLHNGKLFSEMNLLIDSNPRLQDVLPGAVEMVMGATYVFRDSMDILKYQ